MSEISEHIVTFPSQPTHEIVSRGFGQVGVENLKLFLDQYAPLLKIDNQGGAPRLITDDGVHFRLDIYDRLAYNRETEKIMTTTSIVKKTEQNSTNARAQNVSISLMARSSIIQSKRNKFLSTITSGEKALQFLGN